MKNGQAALIATIFLLFISLAILFGASVMAARETRVARLNTHANTSYYLAEAGVEDVAYRIMRGKNFSPSEALTVDGSPVTVTTVTVGNTKTVTAVADVQSAVRKTSTVIKQGDGVSFAYGVQVDTGGITMGNGSSIIGNVASNGNITGNSASQSTITGTALVSGNSTVKDITISQDARAKNFQNCAVGGIQYYVNTPVSCPATGGSQSIATPPPAQNFPISQAQIDAWKAEAAAGGTLAGYTLGNGASGTLGPKKITGNITLDNTSTLTLTGTVWVTGTISFGNNVVIELDPAYGAASGIMILDSSVEVKNGANLTGSGTAGSYLLFLSTFGSGTAIDVKNNLLDAILYAPSGAISVGNGINLREATGYALTIGNNSTLTYDSGLANANFISGPTGSYNITTWNEIE